MVAELGIGARTWRRPPPRASNGSPTSSSISRRGGGEADYAALAERIRAALTPPVEARPSADPKSLKGTPARAALLWSIALVSGDNRRHHVAVPPVADHGGAVRRVAGASAARRSGQIAASSRSWSPFAGRIAALPRPGPARQRRDSHLGGVPRDGRGHQLPIAVRENTFLPLRVLTFGL